MIHNTNQKQEPDYEKYPFYPRPIPYADVLNWMSKNNTVTVIDEVTGQQVIVVDNSISNNS